MCWAGIVYWMSIADYLGHTAILLVGYVACHVYMEQAHVCKHLQQEARGCDYLVLWLDCDRESDAGRCVVCQRGLVCAAIEHTFAMPTLLARLPPRLLFLPAFEGVLDLRVPSIFCASRSFSFFLRPGIVSGGL